jgi:TPR repeat protein
MGQSQSESSPKDNPVSAKAQKIFKSAESERNPEKAAKLYLKSSDLGHPGAAYAYALCLESGAGVEMNFEEAVKYFQKAASQGHGPAVFRRAMHASVLADCVSELRLCAEASFPPAQCALGLALAATDPSEAKALFSSVADQSPMAKFGLWLMTE